MVPYTIFTAQLRYPPNSIKSSRKGLQYDLLVLICMLAQVYLIIFTLAHLLRK